MNSFKLGNAHIGGDAPCYLIAEAGVNHNGNVALAMELVRRAKACGADCVKFQTFRASRVASRSAPKAAYQLRVTDAAESQFQMLERLELHERDLRQLIELGNTEGICVISTPYDYEDASLLYDLGVPAFKLASIHIVELPFLRAIARLQKPLLVSTGMATLGEIDTALRTIREEGNRDLCLLQCTTNYPSELRDANLRAMVAMRETFAVTAGYSDHTEGIAACLASVALGASVIEKHFTLDRHMIGPDHLCSSSPDEFSVLVQGVRQVETALGSGFKQPTERERINAQNMRRSIFARCTIPSGAVITEDMLIFKRPASGISPARTAEMVGRRTRREVAAESMLQWEDLE